MMSAYENVQGGKLKLKKKSLPVQTTELKRRKKKRRKEQPQDDTVSDLPEGSLIPGLYFA